MNSPGSAGILRRRDLRLALLMAALFSLVVTASALAAVGGLTQKAGTAGCVSDDGTAASFSIPGACVDGKALRSTASVEISPDGENAYAASGFGGVAVFDRNPGTGALIQKAGAAGCISEDGTAGACAVGVGLDVAKDVAVSPDGANVYVASIASFSGVSDGVLVFDRNPGTGALTQKAGTSGCVTEDGTAGACADGTALVDASKVMISPDGSNAYVTTETNDSIAIFDRNPTTGALAQKPGTAGCVTQLTVVTTPCADGRELDGASSVTISPDGANFYVASKDSGAVAVFDRNATTGALTQKAGTAGCISDTGTSGTCVNGTALQAAFSIVMTPDGASVYVASLGDAVAVFDRDPTTGVLTQKSGTAGCISETGAGPCLDGKALDFPNSIAVSPDRSSVYVTALNSNAIAILDRDDSSGTLSQNPGTAGCISQAGASCVHGTALDGPVDVTVSPDDTNVYVAAQGISAISIFDRDVPPETTIDSGPAGATRDSTPTFTFSSNEVGATFECKVDGGSFDPCSGPAGSHTAFALADGPHQVQIRAVDASSNSDSTPATRAFTVDTKAPGATILKKPKGKVKTKKKAARVKVSFKSEAGAAFECRLDRARFRTCASPLVARAKSAGGKGRKHTISVRATDGAGNVGKVAAIRFRVIRTG